MKAVSCGYVLMDETTLGVMYQLFGEDGNPDFSETSCLVFPRKKYTDYPVGWIITLDKIGEHSYQNFKLSYIMVDGKESATVESINTPEIKEYKLRSKANEEIRKVNMAYREIKSKAKSFDSLTIGEIKQYLAIHPDARKALTVYLLEML